MKTTPERAQFICPECGSQEHGRGMLGKAIRRGSGPRRDYICVECGFAIPAHLAERWGGLSIEEARREWRLVYRNVANAHPAPVRA